MKVQINPKRQLFKRDKMIYGHFLEHFHRQTYGGVYDPGNPLSDEDGLRRDVIEAMREIEVPVLRWLLCVLLSLEGRSRGEAHPPV